MDPEVAEELYHFHAKKIILRFFQESGGWGDEGDWEADDEGF